MQSVAKNLVTTAASATYGIIQVRMDMDEQGICTTKDFRDELPTPSFYI